MEKYNKLLRNITELFEKGLLSSKDLRNEAENSLRFKMEIIANKLNFCEGNVIKYISRWRLKNGVEDLKKARQYIDFLIEKEVEKN